MLDGNNTEHPNPENHHHIDGLVQERRNLSTSFVHQTIDMQIIKFV